MSEGRSEHDFTRSPSHAKCSWPILYELGIQRGTIYRGRKTYGPVTDHGSVDKNAAADQRFIEGEVERWANALSSDRTTGALQGVSKAQARKMAAWLQQNVQANNMSNSQKHLESALFARLRRKDPNPRDQREYIKILSAGNHLTQMDLRGILHNPMVTRLHPNPERASKIMVCERYPPNIMARLGNYVRVSCDMEELQECDSPKQCGCRSTGDWEQNDLTDGHTCSEDFRKLKWHVLRAVLAKGKKYRLPTSEAEAIAEVEEALERYNAWYLKKKTGVQTETSLEEWKIAILNRCAANWRTKAFGNHISANGILSKAIKEAQKNLVFINDDRAPHNVVIVCKRLYLQKLKEQIQDSSVYHLVTSEDKETILHRHAVWNKKWNLEHHQRLPYMYGVYKPTKKNFRWIAGTAKERNEVRSPRKTGKPRASLYSAANLAVQLLKNIMETLRDISQQRMQNEGRQTCWFVESLEEVAQHLRRLPAKTLGKEMRTVDFLTMYTMLPHDKLLEHVESALNEAWEFIEERTGMRPTLGCEGWNAGIETFTKEKVIELLKFLVENNYISNGNVIRWQQRGIPMGLAVSPQLANLYCYTVERNFVLRQGSTDEAGFRWIDDILAFGAIPSEEEYGMKYKQTSTDPREVTFVGIKTRWRAEEGHWE